MDVKVIEKEVTKSEVLEFHTSRSYNSSREMAIRNIILEVVEHFFAENFKLNKYSKDLFLDWFWLSDRSYEKAITVIIIPLKSSESQLLYRYYTMMIILSDKLFFNTTKKVIVIDLFVTENKFANEIALSRF